MSLIINPGSGPVADTTEANARANLAPLIKDAGLDPAEVTIEGGTDDGSGRYEYTLKLGERSVDVDMPGLPLDKVRYIDSATQNIWDFPRLYVDGSSWVWSFATGFVHDGLTGEGDYAEEGE